MKITFDERGEMVLYRVHDFDPKYEFLLQMCFYENVGNGYVKKYRRVERHLDSMMRRYAEFAPVMFDQLGYFEPVPWARGLDAFCSLIAGSGIRWWLTGSCAACIRGIDLNPHDVDIMIDARDVSAMTELFRDVLIEPIVDTGGWLTKDFGVIFLHCRIDIASDPSPVLDEPDPIDCGPYAAAHLETVSWKGYSIRVPPVELQIRVNEKRGRMDRVGKMKDWMERQALPE